MINWLIKFIMSNSNIGIATTQELSKHRLHTTKYEDLCMQKEYHMAAKKKKTGGSKPKNPALYARVKAEAKRKFKVYPSAYANAWLVRTYKKRGGTY